MIDKLINTIICGDTLEEMEKLPDECIDLIVTSPPYNLKNSTGNGLSKTTKKGKWANASLKFGYKDAGYDDCMPHKEYVLWQQNCLV